MSMNSLLTGDVTQVVSTWEVLTRAWRLYLIEVGIHPDTWIALCDQYYRRCAASIPLKQIEDLRGNIPKAIAANEIQWSAFVRGMSIIDVSGPTLELTIGLRGEEQKVFEFSIDYNYTMDERNEDLMRFWKQIILEYPHITKEWKSLVRKYWEWSNGSDGQNFATVYSNTSSRFQGDTLTWSMFWRGILITNPTRLRLSIRGYREMRDKIEYLSYVDLVGDEPEFDSENLKHTIYIPPAL